MLLSLTCLSVFCCAVLWSVTPGVVTVLAEWDSSIISVRYCHVLGSCPRQKSGRLLSSVLAIFLFLLLSTRPVSLALEWTPEDGRRRLGRPKRTWQDTLKEDLEEMGVDWSDARETASDRARWRQLYSRPMLRLEQEELRLSSSSSSSSSRVFIWRD